MIKKILTFYMVMISGSFSQTYASETSLSRYEELNCLYQVNHPECPDQKIYLLPTQHGNHEVSEEIVNFVKDNLNTVYFESNSDNSTFDYSKEVYERYITQKKTSIAFFPFPETSELSNAFNNFTNFFHTLHIYYNCPDLTQSLQREIHSSLEISQLWNDMHQIDQIAVKLFFGQIKEPENLEIEKYIHPVDLISEVIFQTTMNALQNNIINNLESETTMSSRKITLLDCFIPGTEDSLKHKLEKESKGISFAYLETLSDIKRYLREHIFEHTLEKNPYTKWINIFEELKHVSGKASLEEVFIENGNLSDKIPLFLKQIYEDILFPKRESHWLITMKDIFMNSKGQKGTLFAVGALHIFNLIEKLGKEGYVTHQII